MMHRVLVVATSRKTRGGITSVIKAHETGEQWRNFHCTWIQTHRDGPSWRKLWYFITALVVFIVLLPFCDIVHFHCAGRISARRKIPMAKLARICGKKVLVHFHPPGPQDLFDEGAHEIARNLFDIADCILVLSPQWQRLINEAFPENNYEMKVVWNPCPIVNRRDDIREKQILYAGTILKRKGYDVLIKAFGKIGQKYPDWHVTFVGNPYYENGINEIEDGKQLARSLGIANQVEWLGWVSGEKKEKIFQTSSVYCLASDGEGFPMGVLDAWAYGVPCVMTPVGGIPDIVEDGKNGLLFPVGDVDKLALQLEKMITDESLRLSIVKQTDCYVNGDFKVENVTKRISDIYHSVLIKV